MLNKTEKKHPADDALDAAVKEYFSVGERKRFGLAAFKRGWNDCRNINVRCPYPDTRTDKGQVTFARAYRNSWKRGYDAYAAWDFKQNQAQAARDIDFEFYWIEDRDGLIFGGVITRATIHGLEIPISEYRAGNYPNLKSISADYMYACMVERAEKYQLIA